MEQAIPVAERQAPSFFRRLVRDRTPEEIHCRIVTEYLSQWEALNYRLINIMDTALHPNTSKECITFAIIMSLGGVISAGIGFSAAAGMYNQSIDPLIALSVGGALLLFALIALVLEGRFSNPKTPTQLKAVKDKIENQVEQLKQKIQEIESTLINHGENILVAGVNPHRYPDHDELNVGNIVKHRDMLLKKIGFDVPQTSPQHATPSNC